MTNIYIVLLVFYSLKKGFIKESILGIKKSKYLLYFITFVIFGAFFRGNYIGFLYSIDLLFCFLIIIMYRFYVDKNLFYLLIKVSCLMSLFIAGIGIYQIININLLLGSEFLFAIHNAPSQRVTGVFLNANYYATILEFILLMAFYKLFLVKEKESSVAFYLLVIFTNTFMLYLTGCRTAWAAIFISIPIIFLFQKKYYLSFALFCLSFLGFFITLQLEVFPRIGSLISDFSVRINIWKTGLKGFMMHPLIGQGPYAYMHLFEELGGPKAPHSHSIYVDSLISFGLIPLTFFFIYITDYFIMFFKSSNRKSYALIVGVITTTLIHGIFDFTILEIQVGLFFFLITSSIGINSNTKKETEA